MIGFALGLYNVVCVCALMRGGKQQVNGWPAAVSRRLYSPLYQGHTDIWPPQ